MAEPAKMANGLNAEEDVVDPSEIFRFFELPNELKFKILGYVSISSFLTVEKGGNCLLFYYRRKKQLLLL